MSIIFKLFYITFLSIVHNCWILSKIYVKIVTHLDEADQSSLSLACSGRLNSSDLTTSNGTRTVSKFSCKVAVPPARGSARGCQWLAAAPPLPQRQAAAPDSKPALDAVRDGIEAGN